MSRVLRILPDRAANTAIHRATPHRRRAHIVITVTRSTA
ncbi:hypothetical protein AZ78_2799 [Lysobacter capsici AZ78]|uniref:Uncharacterized protein n=1 Tax=Lysobacter capsici AZ78 TaxID=1444315 RepID=A0A108U9X4_9GAMM|nr:hypothetical protein AZ78_2799 [Lysobacter capsici AZ78]